LALGQQIVPIGYGVMIFTGLAAIKFHFKSVGYSNTGMQDDSLEIPPSKIRRHKVSLGFVIVLALISVILFLISVFS